MDKYTYTEDDGSWGGSASSKRVNPYDDGWADGYSPSYGYGTTYRYGSGVSRYTSGGTYRSPSSYWTSRVSNYSYDYKPKKEDNSYRLKKALHQLARTVNIVENASRSVDEEQPLTLTWSTGQDTGQSFNSPDNRSVVLDPTSLLNASDEDESKIMDALTGKSLILSSMKRTMDLKAFNEYQEGQRLLSRKPRLKRHKARKELAPVASPLWQSREVVKARNNVIKDWVGFVPYFEIYEAESTLKKRDEVEKFIQENPLDPSSFATLVAWNYMNPHALIPIPSPEPKAPVLHEAFGAAAPAPEEIDLEALYEQVMAMIQSEEIEKDEEYVLAEEAARIIVEALPKQEQSDGEGEDEGDDEGEGEGKGGKDDSGGAPTFMDQDLFGSLVDGSPDAEGSRPIKLGDASLDPSSPENVFDYEAVENESYKLKDIGIYRLKTNDADDKRWYKDRTAYLRPVINRVKQVLSFRSTKITRWVHGRSEGELDEGSFHKLMLDNPYIWSSKELSSRPSVAITLLIDESGSMERNGRDNEARDVAIVLTEALKDMPGVSLNVTGHTGHVWNIEDQPGWDKATTIVDGKQLVLREFYSPRHHFNPYALKYIEAIRENLDGYAIEATAKRLKMDYPQASQHIIIHISDGMPCPTSTAQCRAAVDKCVTKLGVEVFAIGIDDAYSPEQGVRLYGRGRSVVLNSVRGSLNILTPFLRQRLSRV